MSAAPVLLPQIDASSPEIRASLVRSRPDRVPWGRAPARVLPLIPQRGGAGAQVLCLGPGAPFRSWAPEGGCRALFCLEGEVHVHSPQLDITLRSWDLALLPGGEPHVVSTSGPARVLSLDSIRFPWSTAGVVRFDEVRPGLPHPALRLAPQALRRRLAPGDTRLLVGPSGGLTSPSFALEGPPQLVLSTTCLAPGAGPQPHVRANAHEAFVALGGSFELRWGDRGQHHEHLHPFDAITIPPGVNRSYRAVGPDRGCLLTVLVGADDALDDIAWLETIREELLIGVGGVSGWVARHLTRRTARRAP